MSTLSHESSTFYLTPRGIQAPQLFKAVTGVSYVELIRFLLALDAALKPCQQVSRFSRRRREGGGRQHILRSGGEKWRFIVFC